MTLDGDDLWVRGMILTPLPLCLSAEGICNMTMDSNLMTMPMSDPNPWATAMNNLGMPPIGITGQQLMQGTKQATTDALALKVYFNIPRWCRIMFDTIYCVEMYFK